MNQPILFRLLVATVTACTVGLATLPGQRLSFEAATIKPNDPIRNPDVGAGWSRTPTRLTTVGSLHTFIRQAYGVEDTQISGGPKWIDSSLFEINAKTSVPASMADQWLMLQTLLAERFKLALHAEARQLPVYSLVVAKTGSKLRQADSTDLGGVSSGPALLRGTMDTAAIARDLTSRLRRTVIDNTGLKGTWKFALNWASEDQTDGASLFTAIQEQLGLKLESTRGPVRVLIIDHAELPSEN
jgi:uncharacterized protein (TIGR03435 family)